MTFARSECEFDDGCLGFVLTPDEARLLTCAGGCDAGCCHTATQGMTLYAKKTGDAKPSNKLFTWLPSVRDRRETMSPARRAGAFEIIISFVIV